MRAFFASSLPENPFLVGLLLAFVTLYVVLVYRLYRPGAQSRLEQESRLPLQD